MKNVISAMVLILAMAAGSVGHAAPNDDKANEAAFNKSVALLIKCDPTAMLPAKILNLVGFFATARIFGANPQLDQPMEKYLKAIMAINSCEDGTKVVALSYVIAKEVGIDLEAYYNSAQGKADTEEVAKGIIEQYSKMQKSGN